MRTLLIEQNLLPSGPMLLNLGNIDLALAMFHPAHQSLPVNFTLAQLEEMADGFDRKAKEVRAVIKMLKGGSSGIPKLPKANAHSVIVQVLKETNGPTAVSELLRKVHVRGGKIKDLPTLSSILSRDKGKTFKKVSRGVWELNHTEAAA